MGAVEVIVDMMVWSAFFIATTTLVSPLMGGIQDVIAGSKTSKQVV